MEHVVSHFCVDINAVAKSVMLQLYLQPTA